MTNLLILAAAALALVAFVLELRRVPYGHVAVLAALAIYAFWPMLRWMLTSDGIFFLVGAACGPIIYLAQHQKRQEALADAARRRAIREQYREIGL